MRLPDIPFEAAVLSEALLTGLAREPDVAAWATDRLASSDTWTAELAEVLLAPEELTAQRNALRVLAAQSMVSPVGTALLQLVLRELRDGTRWIRGTLRVLSDLRREGWLPVDVAAAIKELEDSANMADVGMAGVVAPTAADLIVALASALPDPHYLLTFGERAQCAAFVGSLSRKVVRDRRVGDVRACVWRADQAVGGLSVVLDAVVWRIARREFGPLPVAACIPYQADTSRLTLIFDTERAVALGLDEALLAIAD